MACRYNQGVARLQLLLEAMEAQGTVQNDNGVYRYVRRTPEPLRRAGRSPLPSSSNGNGRLPSPSVSRASTPSSR